MLFAWALALNDDVLAHMVEHTFMMLTALGLYAWGTRRQEPAMGVAAAALWLAHPLVVWLGASAYVDMGLTCFAFLGVYAVRVFWDRGDARWWWLGMALLAAGAGTKMPGLIFLALAAAVGLWARARAKLDWPSLAGGALVAVAIAGPFYAFIAYHTGNPVWPVLAQFSREPWDSPRVVAWNRAVHGHGIARTWLNYLRLPFEFVVHPERFEAERTLFPLLIGWPLAWLVAVRDGSVRWWTLWVLAFTVCWFLSFQQLRYWVSALPMAGLALCESVRWLLAAARFPLAFRHAVWAALALCAVAWGAQSALGEIRATGPFPVTPQAREAFLVKSVPGYRGAAYINDHARPGDIAYVLNASWLDYYLRVFVIDRNSVLERPVPSFRWPEDERMVRELLDRGVIWIVYSHANPRPWKIPTDDPGYRPQWPPYRLVYADPQLWIYRHSPPSR